MMRKTQNKKKVNFRSRATTLNQADRKYAGMAKSVRAQFFHELVVHYQDCYEVQICK